MTPAIIQRNTLWVSECLITRAGVKDDYLRKIRCLHTTNPRRCWRWTTIQGSRYYDYSTIPSRAPTYYRSALPTQQQLRAMATKEQANEELRQSLIKRLRDEVYRKPIAGYTTRIAAHPKFILGHIDTAEQIARRMAWLEVIAPSSTIYKEIARRADLWQIAAEAMSEDWPIKPRTVRARVAAYAQCAENQRIDFFLSHYQNQKARRINRRKVVDNDTGEVMPFDNHLAVAFSLLINKGRANKERKKALYQKYKTIIAAHGDRPASYRTFCRYCTAVHNKMRLALHRDGAKHYNNTYLPYVAAAPLQYANTLWAADGTSSKLGYYDPATGKVKGLYAFLVFDVATKRIIGYSAGDAERPQMVREAFAKAMQTGGNTSPMEIVSDNGPALFANKKQLQHITPLYRTIEKGNSQGNPAETFIRLFINSLRDQPNWMYSSFHATSIEAQANPDEIRKSDLPNREQAEIQLRRMVARWNATTGSDGLSPDQRYESYGSNAKCQPITKRDYRYAFGERTKVDVSYMRGHVRIYQRGEQKLYTVPNYSATMKKIGTATGFRGNAKVIVCSDDNVADIYTERHIYIVSCRRTVLAAKSYAEATPTQRQALADQRQRKAETVMDANQLADDVDHTLELVRYDIAAATAPHGRVKDRYNAAENHGYNETINRPQKGMSAAERGEYEAF